VISFSGSERVGRHIAATAAGAFKRTILELGGNSALVVLADADVDHAVRAAAPSAQLLGPLPVTGAEDRRRVVVTAPFADGPLVAAALKDVRAGESARKVRDLTSVVVGRLSVG